MQTQSNGNNLANDSALAKDMLGLLETAITALFAKVDEKRLLEISRKLIEARQKGEISSATFDYIAGIMTAQWANRKIQPLMEKFYEKSVNSFFMSNLPAK
jgi:hypothetical protein